MPTPNRFGSLAHAVGLVSAVPLDIINIPQITPKVKNFFQKNLVSTR
jgi:hypothetical protein